MNESDKKELEESSDRESYVSKIYDAAQIIRLAADDLEHLSESFRALGLDKAVNRLIDDMLNLRGAEKAIRNALNEELSMQLKMSEKTTAMVLKAALDGQIGGQQKETKNNT